MSDNPSEREESEEERLTASSTSSSTMGFMDKIVGRVKKTAGEMTDDEKVRREGALQERKGEAEDELAHHDEQARRKAEEIADLERRT